MAPSSQIKDASLVSPYFFAVCTKGASQLQASVPVSRMPARRALSIQPTVVLKED